MDADDVAYPKRLERQLEYLERNAEVDLLGCGMLVFRDAGIARGRRIGPQTHDEICQRPTDGFRDRSSYMDGANRMVSRPPV